jgi:glycosyltransferase family 32
MKIPKIIHQIWSGIDETLPTHFKILGSTWQRDYPDWEYIQWDNGMMNDFIKKYYPQYWDIYNRFHYNIQRWDAIRYLILEKMGGMYVDFDYESIEPMHKLIQDKECCFSLEPELHAPRQGELFFNNAMMLSIPGHFFMKKIIFSVFSEETLSYDRTHKGRCVMNTTGPSKLVSLYKELNNNDKDKIYLIPTKYVTPFDQHQLKRLFNGEKSIELEHHLKEAYAVHYFFNTWVNAIR